jgi:hypothetical protein
MRWHQDGHSFKVVMDKSMILITEFHCPNRLDEGAPCKLEGECVVERFATEYGFDCNVGVSEINGVVSIAWTLIGDTKDRDACQVWFIPTDDEFFAAWAASQKEDLHQKE